MKKWYKESYFDRKNWILENFDKLSLNSEETLLLLLIDLCKSARRPISYDYLTKKLSLNVKQIDTIIASLVSKHYLKLSTNSKGLVFDIENIFEFDPEKYEIAENKDLYDTTEDVFGRPLSPNELQKMNDLIEEYGQKQFIEALRISEAQRKVKMAYIEGVLRNVKQ
ncbi:MAG: DnaD domain protein [Erysipelotrichaceae bacterium]|nr:DnaD domain protein [Erysipelotrichaceae bacterium]